MDAGTVLGYADCLPIHRLDTMQHSQRLQRLLGFLEKDPTNPNLRFDTAQMAFSEQDYSLCRALLVAEDAPRPPAPAMTHLLGQTLLAIGELQQATALFHILLAGGQADVAVRHDLAYALACQQQYQDALAALPADLVGNSANAQQLRLRLLHRTGQLETALAEGEQWLAEQTLTAEGAGALALLCLDMDRGNDAARFATLAGNNDDAMVARGWLNLEQGELEQATPAFEAARHMTPRHGRAWLGAGLVSLASKRYAEAAQQLDRAADLLPGHAGSWVAAGWAHLLGGNLPTALNRLGQALDIDRNFPEAHGSMAVCLLQDGQRERAEHHARAGKRLGPTSLSVLLAESLLLQADGDRARAEEIIAQALDQRTAPGGPTVLQAVARYSARADKH